MSLPKSTYHSKLYREFKAIHPESPRDIQRFYDEHEKVIRTLEFFEYFELLVAYVDALFILGKYRQHLLMVDIVIESSIERNIYTFNGQDLFFEMLTCKGLSYLHIYEYAKAEAIFKQLIRIKPIEQEISGYLETSIRRSGAPIQHWSRALCIGLLFLSALVIGLEILLIRPFYEMYVPVFEVTRNMLFVVACVVLVAGEWLHRRASRQKAQLFLLRAQREKA